MTNWKKTMMASGGDPEPGENIEDIFANYVYEGKSNAVTVSNGIDLATHGGMIIVKRHEQNGYHFRVMDTEQGLSEYNSLNNQDFTLPQTGLLSSFNTDGFTVGTANNNINGGGAHLMSWTFRKTEKFFDVVEYTGNGSVRNIAHDLGTSVGMMIIRRTDTTGDWVTFHRNIGSQKYLKTNDWRGEVTDAFVFDNTAPSSTHFTVGTSPSTNASGGNYIAYIWAHNDGDANFGPTGIEDVIKCGSYTGNGASVGPEIDLGFEPQWVWIKSRNQTSDWVLLDSVRRIRQGHTDRPILTNYTNKQVDKECMELHPKGFRLIGNPYGVTTNSNGTEYIYVAIRRGQMAIPTDVDQVFEVATRTGFGGETTPSFVSQFPMVDMGIWTIPTSSFPRFFFNRQSESYNTFLNSDTSKYESGESSTFDLNLMNGFGRSTGASSTQLGYMWGRAPTFFDTFCYKGDGVYGRTIDHNLKSEPKMMWIKRRNVAGGSTAVYHNIAGATNYLLMDSNANAQSSGVYWANTAPTDTTITLGHGTNVNRSGDEYVACLFGNCEGISAVGGYFAPGYYTNVDIGFRPQFVLIKNRYAYADWMVFDTVRGISTYGNDKWFPMNTNAIQTTNTNYLRTYSNGFSVNADHPYGSFLFYAIAA